MTDGLWARSARGVTVRLGLLGATAASMAAFHGAAGARPHTAAASCRKDKDLRHCLSTASARRAAAGLRLLAAAGASISVFQGAAGAQPRTAAYNSLQVQPVLSTHLNLAARLKPNIVVILAAVRLADQASARDRHTSSAQGELYRRILGIDGALFDAFNTGDSSEFESLCSNDIEFYHDQGGVTSPRSAFMETLRKKWSDPDYKARRELVDGSLEVYPLGDFGAVEMGQHRFYGARKGQPEKLDAMGRFVTAWERKNGAWTVCNHGLVPR